MAFPDFLLLPLSLQYTVIPLAITVLCWIRFRLPRSSLHRLPYPPGPPSKNLLSGNLSDIPTTTPWVTYTEWGKKYGDIMHLRIYGQHTVILNSYEVVKDLLEKRAIIYADRPQTTMITLMGWDFAAGLKPYGHQWRVHRRLFQQAFRQSASLNYRPIQTRKINDMLYGILTSPEDLSDHYRTAAAAIIMSVVYGHDIAPKKDYFVTLAEAAVGKLSESVFPGANAVNALPILRHLPAWFPGAGFKRFANETKELTRQMQDVPFDIVEKGMATGTAPPCLVTELMAPARSDEVKQAIKEVAATGYAAGADTTVSSLSTFFLTMAMFPDVQQKAQREISSVIGSDRIVTYDDRESLPYVEAVYREVLRWRPVLPLSVAHCTYTEDIYNGYYIPKGAVVLANMWAMSHDPEKYDNPEAFNPDRYFDENGNLIDQEIYAFGFGRRICVGRHMGSATIWLVIAAVLSTFDIRKKKDSSGNDIPLDGKYTDGLVSHAIPFKCSVTPRSDEAARLIREAVGK